MIRILFVAMALAISLPIKSHSTICPAENSAISLPCCDQSTQNLRPDYKLYDAVLQKYVDAEGRVNYKGLKSDNDFKAVLESFRLFMPENSWKYEEKLAFWINVYNAFTLKLICDNYGVKSIKDIPNAWDTKFIQFGKHAYSLGEIENEIIRIKFPDPRIHFALNCAAVSCPILYNHAYFPETLDRTLLKQARAFVNDPTRNKITQKSAQLSAIFDWYKTDFTKATTLIGYANKFSTIQIDFTVAPQFLEYNWQLNEK